MSKPKSITLHLSEGETRKLTTPYEGAKHAVCEGLCPHCKTDAFGVAGGNMRIEGHDTYAADARSTCCSKPVGTIRAVMSTLFGLEEDERVLVHGRPRVY